jgi:PilZ domain
MTPLARGDFREIIQDFPLTRACAKCGGETEWRLGLLDFTPEEMASPAFSTLASQLAAPGGAERRRAPRYVVLLPLRIRDESGKEELTRSENISKSGLCFGSNLEMSDGSTIHLTIGPAGGEQVQMPARIAWRRPFGAGRFLYGVRLLEEG